MDLPSTKGCLFVCVKSVFNENICVVFDVLATLALWTEYMYIGTLKSHLRVHTKFQAKARKNEWLLLANVIG